MDSALPFQEQPLERPTLLQRLFGRPPRQNALIEINNALAAARSVREVSADRIAEIAAKYRVDPTRKFRKERGDIYGRFLRHCFSDRKPTDEEAADLDHVKQLLGLTDSDVAAVHDDVASSVFGASVKDAVRDGKLSDEEHKFLEKLQTDLKLSDEIATKIYAKAAEARLQQKFDAVVSDERLSPEDERELQAIAKSLGAEMRFDAATGKTLDRYRKYWLIENGELPPVDVGIHLPHAEVCYATRQVEWHELRRVTRRIRYAGPTARIRIAKGFYFRAGDIAFKPVAEDEMRLIDSGEVFLTNKRLIFIGSKKSTNIRLNRVLDFNVFKDGVEIVKDAGKSPFLKFNDDVDFFGLTLGRAIRDLD